MYFKTALNTAVGEKKRDFDVEGCFHPVLSSAVDFMYGVDIAEDISLGDAKSLLLFADFYQMEDLKDVVVVRLIGRQLTIDNIQEICELAVKYTASKLKEVCCDFIFSDIADKDQPLLSFQGFKVDASLSVLEKLDKLNHLATLGHTWVIGGPPVLSMLKEEYSEKQKRCLAVANKLLGVNLTQTFKKRKDFTSDADYHAYVDANLKPNMLVICKTDLRLIGTPFVEKGTIGRIASHKATKYTKVRWQTLWHSYTTSLSWDWRVENLYCYWEILTPPFTGD